MVKSIQFAAAKLREGERLFEAGDFAGCLRVLEPNHHPLSEDANTLGIIGAAHGALGDYKRAVRYLTRAAQKDPRNALWHYNLGVALTINGKAKEAVAPLRRAVQIAPQVAAFQTGLGNALRASQHAREAAGCYNAAIAADPNHVEAIDNLGRLYAGVNRQDAALPLLKRAVEIDRTNAVTWCALGSVLAKLKRPGEAYQAFEMSIRIDPDYENPQTELASLRHELGDWSQQAEDAARLRKGIAEGKPATALFLLARFDEPELHLAAAKAMAGAIRPLRYPFVMPKRQLPPEAEGKIKLLYFSADFRAHPTSQLIRGLLESHDRSKFYVIAASVGADDQSPSRQAIRAAADLFVDLGYGTREELVTAIRSLGPDIAIDLMGHTAGERLEIFLDRVAPIQVCYLGYPGTTGTPEFDYLVADPHLITPENRRFIVEKVIQLPRCYQPNDWRRNYPTEPVGRADFGLPQDAFVYCCFNGARKFTREMFEQWMAILSAVPGSLIWLVGETELVRENLGREASARGVAPERLVFGEFLEVDRHLQRYRLSDCALDTFPYGSHTTGSDALWMGCPLVARAGQSFASRVSASLLTAVGAPELVTTSPRDYVDLAVRMAKEPGLAAKWRAFLSRDRLRETLYNSELFAREIEWAFNEMVERHKRGERPSDLQVPALALQR